MHKELTQTVPVYKTEFSRVFASSVQLKYRVILSAQRFLLF